MTDDEKEVLKIYHDPKQGFSKAEDIYKYFNKTNKLKRIKEIISQT